MHTIQSLNYVLLETKDLKCKNFQKYGISKKIFTLTEKITTQFCLLTSYLDHSFCLTESVTLLKMMSLLLPVTRIYLAYTK